MFSACKHCGETRGKTIFEHELVHNVLVEQLDLTATRSFLGRWQKVATMWIVVPQLAACFQTNADYGN